MFREFNVRLEDVDMIGGADNLLEGTNVTKVVVRGDSKMSSLDSTFKNCNELDRIDGDLDLNGVRDIDNMIENTPLLKSINLKNINNENITADSAFNGIEEMNIGGVCKKGALQNVLTGVDWRFENVNYIGNMSDKVTLKSEKSEHKDTLLISNSLEQKLKGVEVVGQTYENLVSGQKEINLKDEFKFESSGDSTPSFNVPSNQDASIIEIQGETYQNLVSGEHEEVLAPPFETVVSKDNMSFEGPGGSVEVLEIEGNLEQGLAKVVSNKQIFDSIKNSSCPYPLTLNTDDSIKMSGGFNQAWIPTQDDWDNFSIKLKPNTRYSTTAFRTDNSSPLACVKVILSDGTHLPQSAVHNSGFTTDRTGKVFIFPYGYIYSINARVVEGILDFSVPYDSFGLNHVNVVGELYVDSNNEPILDENNKEQYKVDLIKYDPRVNIIPNYIEYKRGNFSTSNGIFGEDPNRSRYSHHGLIPVESDREYSTNMGQIMGENLTSNGLYAIAFFTEDEKFIKCIEAVGNNVNIKFRTPKFCKKIRIRCDMKKDLELIRPVVTFGVKNFSNSSYIEYAEPERKSILLPCPLVRFAPGVSDKHVKYLNKLYWDGSKKKYCVEHKISPFNTGDVNYQGQTGGVADVFNIPKDRLNSTSGTYVASAFISGSYTSGWGDPGGMYPSEIGLSTYSAGHIRLKFYPGETWEFEDVSKYFSNKVGYYMHETKITETNITEKIPFESCEGMTYIAVNPLNPSDMKMSSKSVSYSPLSLSSNKEYTVQFDSIGEGDSSISVDLGGVNTVVKAVDDTLTRHKAVLRTPTEMNEGVLKFSGDGAKIKSVMLFENTVSQNPNYFDSIESIGKLKENGSYEIEVATIGDGKNLIHDGVLNFGGSCVKYSQNGRHGYRVSGSAMPDSPTAYDRAIINENTFKFKANTQYSLTSTCEATDGGGSWVNACVWYVDGSRKTYTSLIGTRKTIISEPNKTVKGIGYYTSPCFIYDVMLEQGVSENLDFENVYEPFLLSSAKINIPCQLNKIGDLSDKFYWDNAKGHYCIDKKIAFHVFDGSEICAKEATVDEWSTWNVRLSNPKKIGADYMAKEIPFVGTTTNFSKYDTECCAQAWSTYFYFKIKSNITMSNYFKSNNISVYYPLETPQTIDLTHLNKRFDLQIYEPVTEFDTPNLPVKPQKVILETLLDNYKPNSVQPNKNYTLQFNSTSKDKNQIKINMGGVEKFISPSIGFNQVAVNTPSTLLTDEISFAGSGNKIKEVMLFEGNMEQVPNYFEGEKSVGVLQSDGKYKIDIESRNMNGTKTFNISILSNSPLGKNDKVFFEKESKKYKISKSGTIADVTVVGAVNDLPRAYQRETTAISTTTGVIKPSIIKAEYNDMN